MKDNEKRKLLPAIALLAAFIFIVARQPYAGIICFSILVIKGFLIAKVKQ